MGNLRLSTATTGKHPNRSYCSSETTPGQTLTLPQGNLAEQVRQVRYAPGATISWFTLIQPELLYTQCAAVSTACVLTMEPEQWVLPSRATTAV